MKLDQLAGAFAGTVVLQILLIAVVVWIIFPFVVWAKLNTQIRLLKKQIALLEEMPKQARAESKSSARYEP